MCPKKMSISELLRPSCSWTFFWTPCTLTILSSKQEERGIDMFVSGLDQVALVQLTHYLRPFVNYL